MVTLVVIEVDFYNVRTRVLIICLDNCYSFTPYGDINWVSTGSCNGLWHDGTKSVLTYHPSGPMTITRGQSYLSHQLLKLPQKLLIEISIQISLRIKSYGSAFHVRRTLEASLSINNVSKRITIICLPPSGSCIGHLCSKRFYGM